MAIRDFLRVFFVFFVNPLIVQLGVHEGLEEKTQRTRWKLV
jgi:hypothetical protein